MASEDNPELTVCPIGYVRTTSRFKFDAPRQPDQASEETNTIELLPGHQFELALLDVQTFDKIWLVSWFDRNTTWRPKVLPPRGPSKRRGVFATRSPHRPNPIGLTCVTLLEVDGLSLKVGPLDLTDGTPILDIKPYLRTVDCHPNSSLGWLEAIEAEESRPPKHQITIERLPEQQLHWLKERNVDFTEKAFAILRRDPTPHRTRRILQIEPNRYRIACGPWRMYYRLEDQDVFIDEITSGLAEESQTGQSPTDRAIHNAYRSQEWLK